MVNKKNITYSFISILIGFILALFITETLIRLVAPQDLSGAWSIYSEQGYHLNKAGGSAQHQFGDRTVCYRFNENHLRGGPINDKGRRVLVVGDSFTFGWLLDEADTYVSHLQSYADRDFGAKRLQFLNGGVVGWGTAHYLAFIEEFGEVISPSIIIVFLNMDDIGRSISSKLYNLNNPTTLAMEKCRIAKTTHMYIKNTLQYNSCYQWLLEHSHTIQLLRKSYLFFQTREKEVDDAYPVIPSSPEIKSEPVFAQTFGRALFRRLKSWCDAHGVSLMVLTTGNYQPQEALKFEPTMNFMAKAREIFQKEGIPYHDLSAEVSAIKRGREQELIIPRDAHPNEAGSEIIAAAAWKWLAPRLAVLVSNNRLGEGGYANRTPGKSLP
ncbi:MAG: SGNH/GDSL hydrolase family protein [Thermodesulfobacteriota bacterium]